MTAVPEDAFRVSSACTYNNNDPRCVQIATLPGKVVVRSSVTGDAVEFTTEEWGAFLVGAKLGEFDVTA